MLPNVGSCDNHTIQMDMDKYKRKSIDRARGRELETPWGHDVHPRVFSPTGLRAIGGSPSNGERPPSRDSGIDVSMERCDDSEIYDPGCYRDMGSGVGYTKTDRNSNIVVPRGYNTPILRPTSHTQSPKNKWCSTPRETATHPAENCEFYTSTLGGTGSARMLSTRSISAEERGHYPLRDRLRRAISPDDTNAFEILPSRRRPPISPVDSVP